MQATDATKNIHKLASQQCVIWRTIFINLAQFWPDYIAELWPKME